MRRREFIISGATLAGAAMAGAVRAEESRSAKASGGPAAPALTADAPHSFEVWDWSDAKKPELAGRIVLDKRIDDFIYEDAEMAAENGAIAVHQSTQSAMLGDIEIGFTLLAADKSNTEARDRPLYQVLGAFAHRGTWKTYPASDSFDSKNHITFPRPFKVVMKNAAGKTLHVFELHDGKPINAPGLNQTRSEKEPLRPKFTVFMMLPWQNTRPRVSRNKAKYYAGMTADSMRPSTAKQHYSTLSCEPLVTGGYGRNSSNGLANIYGAPQWPRPLAVYWPKVLDPYLANNDFNRAGGSAYGAAWIEGWDYEPGSFSCHNWYTGPGGPRFDRCVIPSTIALWASDPNGRRLQESVPWRDMLDAWGMAYFNHGNHWVRDVKAMTLMTSHEVMYEPWGTVGNYYGGGGIGPRSVRVNGDQRDGTTDANRDRNGDIWGNGWARDALHSYCNAGWMALLLNSPMHALGSRFDVAMEMMMKGDPRGDAKEEYMSRTQAWRWLQYVFAWKLASRHVLGIRREDVEGSFLLHLEQIYKQIYVPQLVEKKDDPYFNGLRNLGQPMGPSSDGSKWVTQTGNLGFYMGHVLQLMKQTGMWSAIMDHGGHARDALLLQIRNMDTYALGLHADTTATIADYISVPAKEKFPENMAQYQELYGAKDEDMYHDAKGNPGNDRDVSVHLVAQYIYIRRDYFPELQHPKLKAAVAKLDRRLGSVTTRVAAEKDPEKKRNIDHTYRYPGLAPIRPPGQGEEIRHIKKRRTSSA